MSDITRTSDVSLRASEELYRRILDTTLEGVWMIDLEGNTTFSNQRMADMLGCTRDELASASLWEFIDDVDRPVMAARMAARARGVGEEYELRFRRRDGTFVSTDMVATPITHVDGRPGAVAFVRDLTQSRRIERELRDSETWLNLALSAGGMATWEWDVATGRVAHSVQMRTLLGLSPDAKLTEWGVLYRCLHVDDREGLATAMNRYVSSGSDDRFFHEYRVVRADGVRRIQATGRAFRDPASGSMRILGTATDITERRALEEKLQQAGKLESLGRLAGGVAHDFNNLLTVILASVALAQRSAPNAADELGMVRYAAERAADLTRQLLAFARKQVIELAPTDLNAVVTGLESMLRRLLGEEVELTCRLGTDLWTVRSDTTQLQQVLINLAVNAREAMPHGGPVTIETMNAALTTEDAGADVAPGEYVALRVSDGGTGMDAGTLENIFEPFFTTKQHGTGLGLASSYGIVKQLGGHIAVRSDVGKGTVFTVYLPRNRGALAAEPAPTLERRDLDVERTILVVEDDAVLRRVVVRGLGALGFDVLAAADGEEALALSAAHAGLIDAVITDVVMPRLSGRQLANRLAETRPETKVLFVSGYADDGLSHDGVLQPGRHFLAKPYTVDALVQRLSEVLAR